MGHVFKAMQERLDRIVALKVIRQDRQDTEAIRRFQREARAAAKLSHPNIVIVHDFDQVGDNCFIAMEYVEGTDLYHLVKEQGPLPPNAPEGLCPKCLLAEGMAQTTVEGQSAPPEGAAAAGGRVSGVRASLRRAPGTLVPLRTF